MVICLCVLCDGCMFREIAHDEPCMVRLRLMIRPSNLCPRNSSATNGWERVFWFWSICAAAATPPQWVSVFGSLMRHMANPSHPRPSWAGHLWEWGSARFPHMLALWCHWAADRRRLGGLTSNPACSRTAAPLSPITHRWGRDCPRLRTRTFIATADDEANPLREGPQISHAQMLRIRMSHHRWLNWEWYTARHCFVDFDNQCKCEFAKIVFVDWECELRGEWSDLRSLLLGLWYLCMMHILLRTKYSLN